MKSRYREAEPFFREALQLRRAAQGPQHPLIAQSMNNLALIYQADQRFSEAEFLYNRALDMRRDIFGGEHPDIATNLNSLARLYADQAQYPRAELLAREALTLYRGFYQENHYRLAITKSLIGFCLVGQNRYEDAEPFLLEGYRILNNQKNEKMTHALEVIERIIQLYSDWDRPEMADPFKEILRARAAAQTEVPGRASPERYTDLP